MRSLGPCRALAAVAWLVQAAAELVDLDFRLGERFPHQQECFTEGLILNGSQHEVFESCGLYGRSYLRKYNLQTGKTLKTAKVPSRIFSEGLTLLGERLYMLTYRSRQVLEFDVRTFELSPRMHPFPYGEGWGLTTDGCDLLATTGSSYIYRLRLDTSGVLRLVNSVQVTHKGRPLTMLNELEYVTPKVWINQWHTDYIWRVDPLTGICEARLNIRGLHQWHGEQTPNGVAYSTALGPETLVVTGKQWPQMFSLKVSQRDLCGGVALVAPSCPKAPASACWSVRAALPSLPADKTAPSGKHVPAAAAGAVAAVSGAASPTPTFKKVTAKATAEAVPKELAPAVSELPAPVQPLPHIVTVSSLLLAAVVAVAAVVVPFCISSRRHRYKLAVQRAEIEGSS